MTDSQPTVPDHPLVHFEPVSAFVRRSRHDGWSAVRQKRFLHLLAENGRVTAAARAVGMSPSSAYALRRRSDAAAFRKGWDVALDYAAHRRSKTISRALNGVTTPVFFKGQQIGERRLYDERLTCFLLRHHAARGRENLANADVLPRAKVHEVTGDVS
jgi:hypothetical protein